MTTDNDSRSQAVEFGPLADELQDEDYPMSNTEMLEAYGDREIEIKNETTTLRALIEPLGDVTFESTEDIKQSVIGMVGDDAIGRKNYSDRGVGTGPDDGTEESM